MTDPAPIHPRARALLDGLNAAQHDAVTTTEGPVLVLAGAGTGKTRVLTTRLAYILLAGKAQPKNVLAVTFTNKAAREMRERVAGMTGQSPEGWWLGTFHALGARMLRTHAERLGLERTFTILDTDDQLRLLKQLMQAEAVDEKKWPARAVMGAIQRWKDRGLTPDHVADADAGDLAGGRGIELYRQYQQRLLTLNAVDFGDLLLHPLTLFRDNPDILGTYQRKFQYILVDEYQDTNVAQYLWLRLLAQEHRNLCCVGDDDQCVAADTPVRMADGTEKPVQDIRENDWVLSNYGRGDVQPARVMRTQSRSTNRPLIQITTERGRVLTTTEEHTHFADVVHSDSAQTYYVYLMEKRGVGFRLGTSQIYTQAQKSRVVGYRQRCLQEGADAVWLLDAYDNENDARDQEHRLSLRYGITTFPFVARKGKGRNGLVHDQDRLDRLHADLASEERAHALLAAHGLRPDTPHHVPQTSRGHRRSLHVTLNAEARGATPMHRITVSGNDAEGRDAVRALGLNPRVYTRNPANWRYETLFRDFSQVEAIRARLGEVFDLDLVYKARLMANRRALTMRRACEVRPGMVVVDAEGTPDVVIAVDEIDAVKTVHDLDIAGTHNFIAGGIVTHNSIYGWRGAEVGNILRFEEDYPEARIIRLEENYRSTDTILGAAGGLIANNEGRMGKTLFSAGGEGEVVRVRGVWDSDAEARFVGEEVEKLHADGHSLGEMAVLVRTGAQARTFEERFITIGLPYRVVGGPRFYERQEIRDALAYLRIIQSPDDDLAFERIVNVPKRGLGKKAMQTLHETARARGCSLFRAAGELIKTQELRPQPRRAFASLLEQFRQWKQLSQELDHVELTKRVLDESGYTAMWQQDKSAEAPGRLENLKELTTAMQDFESLAAFLEHVGLVMDASQDDGGEQVTVMTLHSAKGLEFDSVFLAGWEEGLFPNQRAMDEHGQKGLEEERRLAYVGLTRARKRAIISFCANRRMYGSWNAAIPSRFVDELPKGYVTVESEPGLYGGGSTNQPFGSDFWESGPSRATPGMLRAQQRTGESARFVEGTVEVVESGGETGFSRGDRVFHRKFGYGTVRAAEGERLAIAFDQSGEKKVMASFVVAADRAG